MECFLCKTDFVTVQKLFSHFRYTHGLASNGSEVRCTFNCSRVFLSFGALKRHIIKCHGESLKDIVDFKIVDNKLNNTESMIGTMGLNNFDEPISTHKNVNLEKSFMMFVTSLLSKANITQKNVQMVTENMHGLLDDIKSFSLQVVEQLCEDIDLNGLVTAKNTAILKLENISSALSNVDTTHKRTSWLTVNEYFIPPEEFVLGSREEQRFSNSLKDMRTTLIEETFQVVPLAKMLSKVLEMNSSICLIQDFYSSSEPVSKIKKYMDTETYKNNDFFVRHPKGLALHFFVDAFETCNPLGSHTSVHKLEALYCMIANVPPEFNSKVSSIFLVALWFAADVKKYGYEKIFEPVVKQLKQLESEVGVIVNIDREPVQLHAIFAMISADNLGAHSLFGFLESFSANRFCRFCTVNKTDSQKLFKCDNLHRRTKAEYNDIVFKVHTPNYNPSETRIKKGCVLNELQYFHCIDNSVVDSMHDLLEGVVPYEISLILQSLIDIGYVTLEEVNEGINLFSYSLSDINSRPPELILPSLRVKAAEAWCLVRNLPSIIGFKIPSQEPHWQLLILLLDCCAIIFAPEITESLAHLLACLIEDHHTHFKLLYPNKSLTPKHHFLLHYPEIMMRFGPANRYWCMRFEAKHCFAKELSSSVRNFKNICKTIANRTQLSLAASLMSNNIYVSLETLGNCISEKLCNIDDDVSYAVSMSLKLEMQDKICVANSFSFGHYKIKPGCFLIISLDNGLPQFGKLLKIISVSKKIYFVFKLLLTLHFDDHFYSFVVSKTSIAEVVLSHNLKDYHPLAKHSVIFENEKITFINTHYKLI